MTSRQAKILDHTLELLIPDRDKHGNRINPAPVIHELSDQMATYFGAVQRPPVPSVWKNVHGSLVPENTICLKSWFVTDQFPKVSTVLMNFSVLLTKNLNQAQLGATIDGKLTLIDTDRSDIDSPDNIVDITEPPRTDGPSNLN